VGDAGGAGGVGSASTGRLGVTTDGGATGAGPSPKTAGGRVTAGRTAVGVGGAAGAGPGAGDGCGAVCGAGAGVVVEDGADGACPAPPPPEPVTGAAGAVVPPPPEPVTGAGRPAPPATAVVVGPVVVEVVPPVPAPADGREPEVVGELLVLGPPAWVGLVGDDRSAGDDEWPCRTSTTTSPRHSTASAYRPRFSL
jgi:hypothetical protein